MFKISQLFKTAQPESAVGVIASNTEDSNAITAVRNWYEERYESLIIQRNILSIMVCVAIVVVVVSILAVAKIATSKKFDPFVIQIEQQTGAAKIVNPVNSDILQGNEALTRYFIRRYLSARETYNPVDFGSEARKTVRLLSSSAVYWNFIGYIKNKDNDPSAQYGQKNTTYLTIKSWSQLRQKQYMVRFSISETAGAMRVFNKLAIIEVDYLPMELKDDERDINPVGFQITGYKVDDDNS